MEIVRNHLNKDSSPGVPLAAIASTNGKLVENHADMLVQLAYERLMKLAAPIDLSRASAVDLVENGFCDPVRLFVKQEPHSRRKLQQRRYRLISSVSVVDQIIERYLFAFQNNMEIYMWDRIPSKPGMGLSLSEQSEKLFTDLSVKHQQRPAACADISGFDWSVQSWEFDAELYMRKALLGPALVGNNRLSSAISNRFYCFSLSLFQLSDGTMIAQQSRGIMKSGSYLTSSSNSRIRCLMAELIDAPWCIAMGDDSVEGYIAGAPEKYYELGHSCKEYNLCPVDYYGELESVEFCSHHISRSGSYLLTWPKTLYRFLSARAPQFQDLEAELETSPLWSRISAYVQRAPFTVGLAGKSTKFLGESSHDHGSAKTAEIQPASAPVAAASRSFLGTQTSPRDEDGHGTYRSR